VVGTEKIDAQKISHDNRRMTIEIQDLTEERKELEQTYNELKKERDNLVVSVNELQDKVEGYENPQTGPARFKALNVELEAKIDQSAQEIKQLNKQIKADTKRHESECSKLKDEIDFANEKIINLAKLEGTVEIYKKKLEEMNDLK
jgi:chromosome segregation ATPase